MRSIGRLISIAAAGCLALVLSAPVFAQTPAVVVDRIGSVVVDGAQTPVATLSRWAPGTRFRLGDGAGLRLLFVETGAEFDASGPGIVAVAPTGATAGEGAVVRQRTAIVGTRLRVRTDAVAMGGVVMRGGSVRARSPSGVLIRLPAQLSWDDLVADGSYVVRIRTVDGQTLFEQHVSGLALPFPPLKLDAETRYVWSVSSDPTPGRTPVTSSASFELAAPALQADAARLDAQASASFADRVEFALWLDSIGASSEATQIWQRLAESRPDDEAIYARAHR